MLVLRNARVVPELTPGYENPTADIVIVDGKIAEIVAAKTAQAPEDCILDMTDKTVTPGLIDGHVHLDLCGMNTFEENIQPNAYRVLRGLRLAQDNLKKGYTTLRDVGDRNDIIIQLAKGIRSGYCVGPDILASGMILSPTEAGNNFLSGSRQPRRICQSCTHPVAERRRLHQIHGYRRHHESRRRTWRFHHFRRRTGSHGNSC